MIQGVLGGFTYVQKNARNSLATPVSNTSRQNVKSFLPYNISCRTLTALQLGHGLIDLLYLCISLCISLYISPYVSTSLDGTWEAPVWGKIPLRAVRVIFQILENHIFAF